MKSVRVCAKCGASLDEKKSSAKKAAKKGGEEKDRFQGEDRRLTITEVYRGRKEKSGC